MKIKTTFWIMAAFIGLLACGCGSSGNEPVCTNTDLRCLGTDTVQICSDGQWTHLVDCPAGKECQAGECVDSCTPNCTNRECGSNGCSGSCGSCQAAETCNEVTGQCEGCTPECSGRDCGSDSCGGSCGECNVNQVCNETTGACLDNCTPDCTGIDCGLDPECSSLCDSCPVDEECDLPNETCVPVCQADCTDKDCGSDGCDGSCGTCDFPKVCNQDGLCVDQGTQCDDGTCDDGETCENCPEDCGECVECNASTPAEMMECVSQARFLAGIQTIDVARSPGSAGWLAVQNYCATTLEDLGFSIELHNYGTGINVIGTKTGTDLASEQVVILAHYDHVGSCPGADDNASGVSAILEMSRILSLFNFSRSLVVICTDEEESGKIGSFNYARRANDDRDEIVVVFNLDSIAFTIDEPNSQQMLEGFEEQYPELAAELAANQYRATFIYAGHDPYCQDAAVALKSYGDSIDLLTGRVEIAVDDLFMPENMRSDSASFWGFAYPGIIINDTSELRNACYHCRGCQDTVDTLDIEFGVKVTKASLAAVADTLDGLNALFERPPIIPCNSICGLMSTETHLLCLLDMLTDFFDPDDYPLCHEAITTVPECNACINSLPLIEGDCSLIAFVCEL